MDKKWKWWVVAGVALAGLLLVLMVLFAQAMELTPPYTRARIVRRAVDTLADPRALLEYILARPVAVSKCKGAVLSMLRSPSMARFTGAVEARKSPRADDYGNFWTVIGWVDAENAFGATVRDSYWCRISNYAMDGWTVQRVSVGGVVWE